MKPIEEAFKELGGPEVIFDPMPSYDGVWDFNIDSLFKNSAKKDGKLLFEEFYKRTFQDPLLKIFGTDRIGRINIKMVSLPNENMVGRTLRYSKPDFFIAFLGFLSQEVDKVGKTQEEHEANLRELIANIQKDNETLNNAFAQAVRNKAKIYEEVLENGKASKYYAALYQDYLYTDTDMSFTSFLRRNSQLFYKFASGLENLGDFLDQDLDYKELYSCFDPDTFYLMFAKIIYECSLKEHEKYESLNNSYCYLMYYKDACKEVAKTQKRYDPKIPFVLDNGKTIRISRWGVEIEAQELISKYPEAKAIELPTLEGDEKTKYKDIGLLNKLIALYDSDASVSWEFLPKGERIKKAEGTITQKRERRVRSEEEIAKEVEEVNQRINFLEKSSFIGTPIKGLDTFTGYYAFVYPNGKVILEKFWDNEENLTPAIGCATYVMTIDNFVEMSKHSKVTLIEYMKLLPEVNIRRIFHTSLESWQNNISSEIEGTYRLEDAIEFINSLKTGRNVNE